MYLPCTLNELNYIFVHFVLDKLNTNPNSYIKIDRPILNIFNLVVKSLVIIILFAEYLTQM